MADNITIPATGSGTSLPKVSTVERASASDHVQRITAATDTSAVTSVNDTASSVTLLAANADRLAFRIFNDSDQILYVKYGTTATTSDYNVRLLPYGYLEENHYQGRVDGIWAANSSGAAKLVELT